MQFYVVDVRPWVNDAQPSEEVVAIDTELGRRFIVQAKTSARAIARVTRDVVSARKASGEDLLVAGRQGEVILSETDPLPEGADIEKAPPAAASNGSEPADPPPPEPIVLAAPVASAGKLYIDPLF